MKINIGYYHVYTEGIGHFGCEKMEDEGLILYEDIEEAIVRIAEEYDAKPSDIWIEEGNKGMLAKRP